MRNLKNVRLSEVKLLADLPLTATAWDPSSDAVICAFGPAKDNAVLELKRKPQDGAHGGCPQPEDFQLIASWDAPSPLPDLTCDRILSLQYFADNLTACLVLEGGDIVVVREDPQPGEDKIEIVGSVDVGITAAAWSPDEELLAITTRANNLLYMTREFEGIADVPFTPDDLKASRHVSVGWGKKETQFHGKRAKALRDPTMPEKVDEGQLSAHDDGKTTISWRGDGAFVAINSVEPGVRRVIRIYSREGGLDSVSEPVDGLEGALSWRPSGNLIAGIQRLEDRIDVVFFERNGLRHGEFQLRLSGEDRDSWASAINLNWNLDSTVLAVQFKDRLQLWTMGNYHYYLKQELPIAIDSGDYRAFAFKWHQEKALRFVASSSCSILDADWTFDVAHGSTVSPNDVGAVVVVDGKTLKLTPIRSANVPPPMSLCDIELQSNVIDASFSKSGSRIAVLTAEGVSIYRWSPKSKPVGSPKLESAHPLSTHLRPRRISILNENEVYVLKDCDASQPVIERTLLDDQQTAIIYQPSEPESVLSMFPSIGQDRLWISRRRKGKSISYLTISSDADNIREGQLWEQSPGPETVWAESVHLNDNEDILFSMSRSGSLFANKRLLAKNCTSFLVTPIHLIFTTTQHLLKFVHITTVEDLEVPGDTPEVDERCRSIERGGRLVTVMPTTFALTLQMPRGNLETIYPRALVLAGIRVFLDNKNYRSAYLACRSQMVDMNILHDYAPDQFMASVSLFIDQVKKVQFIDEFLSHLKEEDVSQTLYKNTAKQSKPESYAPATNNATAIPNGAPVAANGDRSKDSKVNRICDAFLAVLQDRVDSNLQNLVTAHVCKSPPDLESGLQLVARLRAQSPEQAEDAIEHMCFLSDANQVYNTALGLYDLDLALLVAQQAQRDPREYLPFLQKLQQMPELRKRHTIDNHLGRYAKALTSLHADNAHDEIKSYTIRHTLYKEALELYKYQPEQLQEMTREYADYLHDQSNFKEAGIAYESLSDYKQAYQCYHLAHLWCESLYCASLVGLTDEQLTNHAITLATTLTEESKDYVSASQIHSQHLNDIPTAARLLCRGSKFADACRLLALHGKHSLIPEIVDSGLADAMASTTGLLADFKSQFNSQVPRIAELRVRRAADPLAFFGGDPTAGVGADGGVDIPDNVSLAPTDATTMADRSMFTRYTTSTTTSKQTSKNRRKEERKRARGKKGTVYEEEYLINSVRRLVERVNDTIKEVETLVQALLRRGMRERAAAVEKGLDEVLSLCRDSIGPVFEVGGGDDDAAVDEKGDAAARMPAGADGVLQESMAERDGGGEGKKVPAVRDFKKLVLLGG